MIERLAFGNTGHLSSRIIFGAAALGSGRQDLADRITEQLLAAGINHIDTAASYGESEVALKKFLSTRRAEVFLATKTGERNGAAARAELERSLVRLGVDSVDLIQLHNLVEDEEWNEAFSPSGAVAALDEAKREGLVRHVGVTGHGLRIPRMHLRSLAGYPFASVLFPLNHSMLTIDQYRSDVEELMAVCTDRQVAMQTIKSVARGRWGSGADSKYSWYEPISDPESIDRSIRFVLSHPGVFVNSSSDARLLAAFVQAAESSSQQTPPTSDELAADREAQGITPLFDGSELERI